jgi:transcriptional regulator GlxA family with amidase domain
MRDVRHICRPRKALGALSGFEFANFSAEKQLYDIHVLSEDGGPIPSAAGTSLETTAFGDRRFDTIIIGGTTRAVPTSPKLLTFLSSATKTSRRLSSICTGVFALTDAALGNRRVTTHWLFTDELKTLPGGPTGSGPHLHRGRTDLDRRRQ